MKIILNLLFFVGKELNIAGENFAYVVLKRKTFDTIEKTEKLVLTMYVLLSRIGGLCSLTIGLTAAFAVEMIEFFYLIYYNGHPPQPTVSYLHSDGDIQK